MDEFGSDLEGLDGIGVGKVVAADEDAVGEAGELSLGNVELDGLIIVLDGV